MAGDAPWPQVPVGNKDHANPAVVIIGAGISGLCMAIDLIKRNNCRNFVILEKSAGLGGTWYDNKYPGCCCDVWSTLYSYSFAQKSDWSREYPGQEEVLAYLIGVAQEYRLYPHIRFNTTVEESRWDDELKKWRTRVATAKGSKEAEFNPEYEITSDFLVSGVGQLNQPKWPDIEGLETFASKKMHSARWDWSYDLTDKKIALIGSGCTAVQILPEVAKVAKKVTIFQRTPGWVVPRLDKPVTPFMRNVLRCVPPLRWRKRAYQMEFREYTYDALVDSTSDVAKTFTNIALSHMHQQLPDQPELWKKLTPNYNIGCKRIIMTDDFYPALDRPNVDLETREIHSIDGNAVNVVGADGSPEAVEPDYDLLVCATGFKSVEFLSPIKMYGKGGRPLSEVWEKGAHAYLGTCVEDFPNFGMLYGPNTNLGHNSIILMIESQSRYLNGLLKPILTARKQGKALSLSPKREKVQEYNEKLQSELKNSSFNDPKCSSWYKNEAGLITNNWSGHVDEYQKKLSKVSYDDYVAEGSGKGIVKQKPPLNVGWVPESLLVSDRTLILLGAVSTAALLGSFLLSHSKFLSAIKLR